MKKEIMELLNKDEGSIELKKDFYLIRYTKDALDNEVDKLEIEFRPYYGKCWKDTCIKSRNFTEIKQEILDFMKLALNEYNEFVIKEFENGKM